MTPEQLRADADASERLAQQISFLPHKRSLLDDANALRQRAARQERSWRVDLPGDR